ncbi:hypothetical protein EBB07_32865 [Paenibacillaceae bacterium]|nr:hypothetical protein EBB07_32865 [Paenibacillaceae bacterium]
MKYVFFVIGSSIEYFSIFMLMFTLFRFQITERLATTLMVSIMMSQVSYITRLSSDIGELSSYIQLVLMILVVWILFRVPWYYSILMNFASFVIGFAIQGITIFLLSLFQGVTLESIQGGDSMVSASVQLLCAVLVIAVSRLIYLMNFGFDYVPVDHRAYVQISGTNEVLIVVIIATILLAVSAALVLRDDYKGYAIVATSIFALTVPLFMYYSRRKDREDA